MAPICCTVRSQFGSITGTRTSPSMVCTVVNKQCNTNLTISGCLNACLSIISLASVGGEGAEPTCRKGGTSSVSGVCNACVSSGQARRIDFKGSCPAQYAAQFLDLAKPLFFVVLDRLSQCLDTRGGNAFRQTLLTEIERVYCVDPSPSPTSTSSATPTASPSMSATPTISATSSPTPSSAVSVSPTISATSSPTPSSAVSVSPTISATSSPTPTRSPAKKPHGPRPGRNESACVRQLRRCVRGFRRRRLHGRRGRLNNIVRRCCRPFCKCRSARSRRCIRVCQISYSFDF
ncbi:unnamed protein product [Chondrus crispus]|uniref:Uncharacterized protein n=1 Tax=Chondrus crispus TaxID=2769 RepID=R7Q755_CHOCR|nr:unnamed protein product [Chondrus crispus]CDF33653.1 unnamed protein product [Chondrus crispus]|eukprot:XP_005713472.1 unnamed protein product [Chondrus crispus]